MALLERTSKPSLQHANPGEIEKWGGGSHIYGLGCPRVSCESHLVNQSVLSVDKPPRSFIATLIFVDEEMEAQKFLKNEKKNKDLAKSQFSSLGLTYVNYWDCVCNG